MKKFIPTSILAFALYIPTSIYAQQTVSSATVKTAVQDAKQYFCNNGSGGFSDYIKQCYQNSGSADRCLLDDVSLSVFDYQFREALKNHTGKEIPPNDSFLTKSAINARQQKYFLPKFGTMDKAYTYLKPGIEEVTNTMGQCLADNMDKENNKQATQPNSADIITKEGDGETQTPPMQLNCPCMVTWQVNKNNNTFSVFNLDLIPVNGGFPVSIATMAQTPQGEYYIPATETGKYMMKVISSGHWTIQIKQNWQQ